MSLHQTIAMIALSGITATAIGPQLFTGRTAPIAMSSIAPISQPKTPRRLALDTAPNPVSANPSRKNQVAAAPATEKLFSEGVAHFKANRPQEAIAAFEQAIKLDPSIPAVHYNLAMVRYSLKEYPAAIASFQQAIRLNPNYYKAWLNLGNVLDDQGEYEKAIASYGRAATIEPDNGQPHLEAGIAFRRQKQYPQALKALQLGSADLNVPLDLGIAYYNTEQYRKAIPHYKTVTDRDPKFATGYAYLGDAYFRSGQMPEAIAAYEAALKIDPNNSVAQKGLSTARAKTL
jgi:tetratricopeptide (TPR) repeat protein